jgi:hypothetical protein
MFCRVGDLPKRLPFLTTSLWYMFSTDPHSGMIQTSLHYRDVAKSRPNEAIKVVDKPVQRGDSIAPAGRSAIEKGRVIYFSEPSLKRSESGMGVLPVESQGRRDTRVDADVAYMPRLSSPRSCASSPTHSTPLFPERIRAFSCPGRPCLGACHLGLKRQPKLWRHGRRGSAWMSARC